MKSFSRFFAMALYILVPSLALAFLFPPAHTSLVGPGDPLGDIVAAATALLASLVGIPAFTASLLTLLEYFGLITEMTADKVQLYLNTVLYIAALVTVLLGKTPVLILIDKYLGGLNPILVAIILFLGAGAHSIIATSRFQFALRGLSPVASARVRRMRIQ